MSNICVIMYKIINLRDLYMYKDCWLIKYHLSQFLIILVV